MTSLKWGCFPSQNTIHSQSYVDLINIHHWKCGHLELHYCDTVCGLSYNIEKYRTDDVDTSLISILSDRPQWPQQTLHCRYATFAALDIHYIAGQLSVANWTLAKSLNHRPDQSNSHMNFITLFANALINGWVSLQVCLLQNGIGQPLLLMKTSPQSDKLGRYNLLVDTVQCFVNQLTVIVDHWNE